MKKRWLSLYVENDVGVLAKISGLFSGKSYNLESLTVGPTEDETISRMTIGVKSDDITFEQIKKQLNRCVEVIKVIDFTSTEIKAQEVMLLKVKNCSKKYIDEIFRMAKIFDFSIEDYGKESVLIRSVKNEEENNKIIKVIKSNFSSIEVVRGGTVAIESIN